MEQSKVFGYDGKETLQEQINRWLKENHGRIHVVDRTQSGATIAQTTVIIWYTEVSDQQGPPLL